MASECHRNGKVVTDTVLKEQHLSHQDLSALGPGPQQRRQAENSYKQNRYLGGYVAVRAQSLLTHSETQSQHAGPHLLQMPRQANAPPLSLTASRQVVFDPDFLNELDCPKGESRASS